MPDQYTEPQWKIRHHDNCRCKIYYDFASYNIDGVIACLWGKQVNMHTIYNKKTGKSYIFINGNLERIEKYLREEERA